jgi:TorA maturation chaperone TorD
LIKLAKQRSNVYGLFSLIYSHELTGELIDKIRDPTFLKILSELGLGLDKLFTDKPNQKLLHDLQVEYTRLFLGPGKHISVYESAQRKDDTGSLWGKSTSRVKRFIEATGLKFRKGYGGIPDHIGVELDFMQRLTQEESLAWKKKDHDSAIRCLEVEKRFMDEHLNEWVPGFCDKVAKESKKSFYGQMAKLTKKFIKFDKKQINDLLSPKKKERR